MNIAIYVRSLQPASPASARFQESILEGLEALDAPDVHFYVLSEAIPESFRNSAGMTYLELAQPSPAERAARKRKLLFGGLTRRALRLCGMGASGAYHRVTDWLKYEPAYFQQLRNINIRMVWNLGVDILPSYLPFTMVQWDCNYRIHSMFPEYSYLDDIYSFHDKNTAFLERASYVIVGTEQGKRETVDNYTVYPGKIRVIPFPTPTLPKVDDQEAAAAARAPYLFYPARFWPHKNHIVLVHALGVLKDRNGLTPRVILSGIDNGNYSYVMRTAERFGVADQINYLGNVPIAQLAALYRNAMTLVYCSSVGPDNFPPLEAMVAGCPVIAAQVPGANEQYGDAVMLFDPNDEHQLADCIVRMLDDDELRRSYIQKGLNRAQSWTPANYAQAMLGVVEDFARKSRMWEFGDYRAER